MLSNLLSLRRSAAEKGRAEQAGSSPLAEDRAAVEPHGVEVAPLLKRFRRDVPAEAGDALVGLHRLQPIPLGGAGTVKSHSERPSCDPDGSARQSHADMPMSININHFLP